VWADASLATQKNIGGTADWRDGLMTALSLFHWFGLRVKSDIVETQLI
jgi:hypothetical protein